MKLLKNVFLGLLLSATILSVNAQSEKKSYTFKKGEVMDILFLSQKPETKEKLQEYFKLAFPVANRLSYKGLGGHAVINTPTQGNYHPEVMVFGTWQDVESRDKFLVDIDIEMPTFHEMRRQIWSNFDVIYYEMKQDLSFEIDPEKYNVVTYYWEKDKKAFQRFKQEWLQKAKKAGGHVELELTDGMSPLGYVHNPDYLTMTVWDNKDAFNKFYEENLKMNHSSVEQVNQFKIM